MPIRTTTSRAVAVSGGRRWRSLSAPSGCSSAVAGTRRSPRVGRSPVCVRRRSGSFQATTIDATAAAMASATNGPRHPNWLISTATIGAPTRSAIAHDISKNAERASPPPVGHAMADPGVAGHGVVGHPQHEHDEGDGERGQRTAERDDRRDRHESERRRPSRAARARDRGGRRRRASTGRRTRSTPMTVVSWVVVETPNAPSSVGRNGGIQRSAVLATAFAPVIVARVDCSTPSESPGDVAGMRRSRDRRSRDRHVDTEERARRLGTVVGIGTVRGRAGVAGSALVGLAASTRRRRRSSTFAWTWARHIPGATLVATTRRRPA